MATFGNIETGRMATRASGAGLPIGAAQAPFNTPLPVVDVSPPGYAVPIRWNPVTGATGVQVDSASVRVGPALVPQTTQLPVSTNGAERILAIPAGQQLIALTLDGLKWRHAGDDGATVEDALASADDLSGRGLRLVVSIPAPTGGWTPLLAVPGLGGRGVLPPALQSTSFSQGVLSLPNLSAASVRLNLVTGDAPDSFTPQDMALDATVSAQVGLPSANLKVTGPDGAVLWSFPATLPPNAPDVDVDLTAALERAMKKAVATNQPPAATFTVLGSPGSAGVAFPGAQGALLRVFPGVLRSELTGDPFPPTLGGPLADEPPASATADLTVRYEGLRILEPLSDAVPGAGGTAGTIVTDQPVTRALPPEALTDLPVARIGLIGRCPLAASGQPDEPCELSVQLVDMSAGAPGPALGKPGVVKVAPSITLSTVWVDFPALDAPKVPVGVLARATKGRFFWAGTPSPLLRIAVRDPDPGGRPLRLNDRTVLNVTQKQTRLPAQALPGAVFRNAAPAWDSALFLTVDLSDLTLRYPR